MAESTADLNSQSSDHIAPSDYARLMNVVYESCGIQLNDSKKLMVETRLRKRLRATGAKTFREYWKLLNQDEKREGEWVRFINVITTNKTDFFREPAHFDYLVKRLLPELAPQLKAERRPLLIWSAGCSTGKEAYTLAMVLSECQRTGLIRDFSILGTDISSDVLRQARRAVYEGPDIEPIPESLRKKYLLRSRTPSSPTFRMAREIRSLVQFERLNFMDESYGIAEPFDIIFCRNVIIYFDRPTQQQVVSRFWNCLRSGGYLFTGHSETLNGLVTGLSSVAPTIYRKGRGG
jgi:chemotaxis protein methyltransferase CheR